MKTADLGVDLAAIPGLKVRTNVPLGRLTTFKIGGPAAVVVTPESVPALSAAQRLIRDAGAPSYIFGNGSNLLVSDAGYDGVVIRVGNSLGGIEPDGPDRLRVGAGTMWSRALRFCMKEGWSGLEFGAGIPGTIGGGVATNAGTRGGQTGDDLIDVEMVLADGEIVVLPAAELKFRYRGAELPAGAAVTSTRFRAGRDDPAAVTETVRGYQAERRRDQPERVPSAGCMFKNPPGSSAGLLIDQAGLKTEAVGGAIVSEKHGNFIVNRGDATAADVLRLVDRLRERILAEHGIELEMEVRTLGFP